jgi:hypothetical protein
LWRCGQGASLVHHVHRLSGYVGLGRRAAGQGGVGPFGVVQHDDGTPTGPIIASFSIHGILGQVAKSTFMR